MDFKLSEEQDMIIKTTRDFVVNELYPHEVEIENTGDTLWLVSRSAPKGTVRLGVKILAEGGELIDEVHGSPSLSRAVAPGETVSLTIVRAAPNDAGQYKLKIDLLDQDICWFEQHGSEPLEMKFAVA